MTDTTPAAELQAAAEKLRSTAFLGARTSTSTVAALLRARAPLGDLLELAAKHYDDGFLCCEHGPDSCSEVIAPALPVARQINGNHE